MLQDYELIYKDKVAYIKIPLHIRSINELKENVKFRGAVAEVITTILDVDGDKDAFLIILACKSTKEAEEYFIENGDDDLSTVNLAKAKFSDQIDRKTEFWHSIENALGIEKIDESQHADLMIDFDYNNLNCFSNCLCIIKLFKKLGIDVERYNQYAFEIIDLQPYYKEELRQIKQKYREKYFIYLVSSGRIKTKLNFEEAKRNYDELTLATANSVDVQLEKIFENKFGVSVSVLNDTEGNLDELLTKLNDDSQENHTSNPKAITPPVPAVEVNYDEINAQIASTTNAESKKVGLSALSTTISKNVGSKKKGRTYDSTTTKAKEENGFIAECKVYHTLRTRIGAKGSVVWVSSNGYRARENQCGDDSLGYDIWYSDENGKKHYVEVKGSISENVEFVLTQNELEFAEQHAEEYEIWYVRIVNKQPTIPYELGNLLLFSEEETFFNNSKFAVENSEFRIRSTMIEEIES